MADVHLNWLKLFHLLILEGGPLVILIDYMIFPSPFLDEKKISMSIVSCLVQLDWNSLPMQCFPLTYVLNGFKSRINRDLLTVGSLETDFLQALIFLCFFFL